MTILLFRCTVQYFRLHHLHGRHPCFACTSMPHRDFIRRSLVLSSGGLCLLDAHALNQLQVLCGVYTLVQHRTSCHSRICDVSCSRSELGMTDDFGYLDIRSSPCRTFCLQCVVPTWPVNYSADLSELFIKESHFCLRLMIFNWTIPVGEDGTVLIWLRTRCNQIHRNITSAHLRPSLMCCDCRDRYLHLG